MNNKLVEDKNQMPNLEHLVDIVADQLFFQARRTTLYTSIDMRYANKQVPFDKETIKHCMIEIIGEKTTGTYGCITGCID